MGRGMLRATIGKWSCQRTYMTLGHEQRRGDCQRELGVLGGGGKSGKGWDKL